VDNVNSEKIICVTCTHCGRVGVKYTPEQMNNAILRFNDWFESQTQSTKDNFGNKQSKESDYSCLTCGHYGPYRLFKAGDCPDGCTISPVVIYGEILG